MSTLHSADCRLLGAINSCDEELVLEACQRDGAALSSLPMTLQCSKNFDVGVLSKFSPAVEKQSTVEKAQCCFMNVPKLAGTVLQMIFRRRWSRW